MGGALVLALLSGVFLLGLGLLRFGWLANLLSHPVISGFITASAIVIAAGQVRHGVAGGGETLPAIIAALAGLAADEPADCQSARNPASPLECAPRIGQMGRFAIDRGRAF